MILCFSVVHSTSSPDVTAAKHGADAALHLGALKGELAQADVVDGLDALLPGVDLRLVDIAGRRGVAEEQRQRQALVDVLRGRRIGVDDLSPGRSRRRPDSTRDCHWS